MKRKPVLPPTYLLAAIVIMVGLHFLLPVGRVVISPYRYLGTVPLAIGLILNIRADALFKRVKTTAKPFEESDSLVTSGPYRFSRHPMYLGMTLIVLGLAALLGTIAPIAVVPVFALVMDRRFIAAEEKMLEERFGEAHRDYRKRVRRWI